MKSLIVVLFFLHSVFLLCVTDSRIYINSVPKGGTHLLARCLELLTGQSPMNMLADKITDNTFPTDYIEHGGVYYFHVPYSDKAAQFFKKHQFKCYLIYRDPRDQVVSHALWIIKTDRARGRSLDELITHFIKQTTNLYKEYMPWMAQKNYYAVRFEDLVGPSGGGSWERQTKEIIKIANFGKINASIDDVFNCARNMFGHGINASIPTQTQNIYFSTFREGKIGEWKRYFTPYHKQLFCEHAGQLLISLKYEVNHNWAK